jgi:hypothetical protein
MPTAAATRYHLRKAEGLCVACGITPAPNRTRCGKCASALAVSQAKYVKRTRPRKSERRIADDGGNAPMNPYPTHASEYGEWGFVR